MKSFDTLDDVARFLEDMGLIVQTGPGFQFVVSADPYEPPEALQHAGVVTVYRFGFSARQIDDEWLVHSSPPKPAARFTELSDVVKHGLALLGEHRETFSPEVYGDQYVRFEADAPLDALEKGLVEAGWLEPPAPRLKTLGLAYVSGAHFSLEFAREHRIVIVNVTPGEPQRWRANVKCWEYGIGSSGVNHPWRSARKNQSSEPDPVARRLSFEVAEVLHRTLLSIATRIRWSVHCDPDHGVCFPEPQQP